MHQGHTPFDRSKGLRSQWLAQARSHGQTGWIQDPLTRLAMTGKIVRARCRRISAAAARLSLRGKEARQPMEPATRLAQSGLASGRLPLDNAAHQPPVHAATLSHLNARLFPRGHLIRLDTGCDMFIPPDPHFFGYVVGHEAHITRLIEEVVGEGDTCVDVGANIGYFSLMMAARCGRSARSSL